MRLGDVLSKDPLPKDYTQIEAFLSSGMRGSVGQQININIGDIRLNYYCTKCENLSTFWSKGNLSCIYVNPHVVSIDSTLSCQCGSDVQVWFLVESETDIRSSSPKIRIIKKSERLSEKVLIHSEFGDYSLLLDRAEKAYRENLGAGAIVYLRKILEKITIDTAQIANIGFDSHEGGNPKNFGNLLKKVDGQCSIIPKEFATNGYRLFEELSTVVHGDYDEEIGISKYKPLKRLVIGILENLKNREELHEAIGVLGWVEKGVIDTV